MEMELFRTANLLVRARIGFPSATCVITFNSYTDRKGFEHLGFGEDLFQKNGVNAVHFIAASNDWYLYPEIEMALHVCAHFCAQFTNVSAYGSSMGAYAAIRFGSLSGASRALALSPQYSIDPSIVPFDNRWICDAERLDFSIEKWLEQRGFVNSATILFDPYDLDVRHIKFYRNHCSIELLPLPYGGHPVTGFLLETGLLKELVLSFVQGPIDLDYWKAEARERAERSPQYFVAQSNRKKNKEEAHALLEKALHLSPHHFGYLSAYAESLGQLKRRVEAIDAFDRALLLSNNHQIVLSRLSQFLIQDDQNAAAAAILDWLLMREAGSSALLQVMRSKLGVFYRYSEHRTHNWLCRLRGVYRNTCTVAVFVPTSEQLARFPIGALSITPSPPLMTQSWLRHAEIMCAPIQGDLWLVGDSYMQYWPQGVSEQRFRIVNCGVAEDRTQHTLWRLACFDTGAVNVSIAILILGVNNLAAGESIDDIVAGIRAVIAEMQRVAPDAQIVVLSIPPTGTGGTFRRTDRHAVNQLIQSIPDILFVDIQGKLEGVSHAYHIDEIHFNAVGYELIWSEIKNALLKNNLKYHFMFFRKKLMLIKNDQKS